MHACRRSLCGTCVTSPPKLREWYASMHNAYGADTRFLKACADAKEMYTAIPHNFLLRAIEYIIDRCETTKTHAHVARRYALNVPRGARSDLVAHPMVVSLST